MAWRHSMQANIWYTTKIRYICVCVCVKHIHMHVYHICIYRVILLEKDWRTATRWCAKMSSRLHVLLCRCLEPVSGAEQGSYPLQPGECGTCLCLDQGSYDAAAAAASSASAAGMPLCHPCAFATAMLCCAKRETLQPSPYCGHVNQNNRTLRPY